MTVEQVVVKVLCVCTCQCLRQKGLQPRGGQCIVTPTVGNSSVKHWHCGIILLPAGTSFVLPVGYMDQPTGLLHVYLWRRLCGRSGEDVIQITSSQGFVDNIFGRLCEF